MFFMQLWRKFSWKREIGYPDLSTKPAKLTAKEKEGDWYKLCEECSCSCFWSFSIEKSTRCLICPWEVAKWILSACWGILLSLQEDNHTAYVLSQHTIRWSRTPPMLTGRLSLSPESSQHSRSQARVKEEGCFRFWQTSIKNNHSNGFETHKKLVGGVTLLATHYIRTRVWW